MRICEISIRNWRSIKNISLTSQEIMILIGQNNHGKSNIISALLFFFGEINLDTLDFNIGSDELTVEITFDDLDAHDKRTFKKYVTSSNTIKVIKQASPAGGSSYHGYVETPNEDWLIEENISNYTKREEAEKLPLNEFLPESGRITKDQFLQAQEQYIEANRETLNFSYRQETGPFLGAKNVAKGIFGEVYFVPAIKKAEDAFSAKGRSVFGSLYSHVINKMSEANPQFKEAKEKISSLMRILNKENEDGTDNDSRPTELTSLEEALQAELSSWDTKIDVEITPPNIDDIFKVGATVWVDDGIRTDVARKGQGLQRALIFALVRALAKLTTREQESATEEENAQGTRSASKSSYFIIEEPELFLHPQAQRELFASLHQLSQADSQVFLCTHSSSFMSLDLYRSICIVRKNSLSDGTTILQCTEDLFPDAKDKDIFNLTYWINPDRGELFFARRVILVEGSTDKTVLPLLATELGVFRHDYTVIDCGSKDSIPSYIQLLNKFRIPYMAVYDRDHQANKNADGIASADKASLRIENQIIAGLGKSVILENDIEEEIGILGPVPKKSKPFAALTHVTGEDYAITTGLESKIRTIYE